MINHSHTSKKIAIIGGGSWATALLKIITDNGSAGEIFWWMRNEDTIEYIRTHRRNPRYLSSMELKISADCVSNNLEKIIDQANILIFVTPTAFLKEVLEKTSPSHLKGKILISAIKGFIPGENMIVGEFFHKKYHIPWDHIAIIAGPCHAEEVASEKLSYLTVASVNTDLAYQFADFLKNEYIKTILSADLKGVEYSAALKNIYAIGCGICIGLNYGDNFQAVFISNAIREIRRFLDIVHPFERDVNKSAYVGDLLVTAYSQFSRNRTFGNMIGKGYSVKTAQLEMAMVAEGYYACKCLHEINTGYKVYLPIFETIYSILYEKKHPRASMEILTEKLK